MFNEHKKELETTIVETLINSLNKDIINAEEVSTIAEYILDRIDKCKTQQELLAFLRELSAKWAIFTPVLVVESGELKEQKEEKVIDQIESLTAHGDIEEAIRLAKSMTTQGATT